MQYLKGGPKVAGAALDRRREIGDYKAIPFARLTRPTQGQAVRTVLPEALAIIEGPTPTRLFAQLVARRLRLANWWIDPDHVRDTNAVATSLMRIAPFHLFCVPTGETFELHGRVWRRWRWYPSHQPPPAMLYRDVI